MKVVGTEATNRNPAVGWGREDGCYLTNRRTKSKDINLYYSEEHYNQDAKTIFLIKLSTKK